MRILYNLKIVVKLLVAFVFLIGAVVLIGILGINSMRKIDTAGRIVYENNFLSTVAIEEINNGLGECRLLNQRIVLAEFRDVQSKNLKLLKAESKQMDSHVAEYEASILKEEDRKLFADFKKVLQEYKKQEAVVVKFSEESNYLKATKANEEELEPIALQLQEKINALVEFNRSDAKTSVDESTQVFKISENQIIVVIAVAVLFAILLCILISRVIKRPLKEVNRVSNRIAEGDLTVSVKPRFLGYKDEIGDMARNIDAMKKGLLATVSGIKHFTDELEEHIHSSNVILNQLSDGINDTSAATEQLSASMEETGASAEEMNATAAEIGNAVENVANMAGEGAHKAGEIHSRASELDKNVEESINKSDRIFKEIREHLEKALEESKAVDEINALADAILGITSQTNLLALNASIEAARAGEAGKGFAVVANEIGALADDSKNTANEIQTITKVVMTAVGNLSESADRLLKFVSEDVNGDYKDMMVAADAYSTDSVYISDMTSDLSATAEQLAASVQTMMTTINEVSYAAQEGVKTTSSVADQTTEIANGASVILENMENTEKISQKLMGLVNKFKL